MKTILKPYTPYSGNEFNKFNINLFQLTDENDSYNNMVYTDLFTTLKYPNHYYMFLADQLLRRYYFSLKHVVYIRKIEIYDDSQVYVDKYNFIVDNFISGERKLFNLKDYSLEDINIFKNVIKYIT